jgi:predicted Zn-dependent peptidase
MLDRKTPPIAQPLGDFSLVKPQNLRLDNGMPAHVLGAGEQPVISVTVWFRAGTWFAPTKETAILTMKMMTEGTRRRTAAQVMEEIDKYGAFLECSTGLDHAEIEMYCLSRYLPAMLRLVCECLTEPTFPEDELEKLKQINIQSLRINQEKTNFIASSKFRENLFGEAHPYGAPLMEGRLRSLHRANLADFFARSILGQPFEVMVAGQVREEDLQVINATLGQLPVGHSLELEPFREEAPAVPQAHLYVERDSALQTSLRIGKKISFSDNGHYLGKRSADYLAFTMLNEILGGYFGSRLMRNIREEKGLTYGINSSIVLMKSAAYMVVGTDVKKEIRDLACEEIGREIAKLAQEPVGQAELDLVKNYMQGTHIGSLTTPFTLAEKFKSIYFHGLDEDYYDHYVSKVRAITADQLLQLAQKYYHNDFFTVMAG